MNSAFVRCDAYLWENISNIFKYGNSLIVTVMQWLN
jgi:hypothetical protein